MTDQGPFDLPSETLDQAVAKAEAILKYWRGPGEKPWRDELDAAYAVATRPGGAKWGNGSSLACTLEGENRGE